MSEVEDVTFEMWCQSLDRHAAFARMGVTCKSFDPAALHKAYMANDSPQEFLDRAGAKPGLPSTGAPIPPSPSSDGFPLNVRGWILVILGFAISAFASTMDVRAPGTEIANLDLEMQRLGLVIAGEVTGACGFMFFAAHAIVRAIQQKDKA